MTGGTFQEITLRPNEPVEVDEDPTRVELHWPGIRLTVLLSREEADSLMRDLTALHSPSEAVHEGEQSGN